MKAHDLAGTLDLALAASGLDAMTVVHRSRLVSENGASSVAGELERSLRDRYMEPIRGAHFFLQSQGNFERWRQALEKRISFDHHYRLGDLERSAATFAEHDNHARHHGSLDDLTPADAYYGWAERVLSNVNGSNVNHRQMPLAASPAERSAATQTVRSLPKRRQKTVSDHWTRDSVAPFQALRLRSIGWMRLTRSSRITRCRTA